MERDEIMNLSLSENSSDPKNAGCKLIKFSLNVFELLSNEAPTESRNASLSTCYFLLISISFVLFRIQFIREGQSYMLFALNVSGKTAFLCLCVEFI
jgi:hypothetical protein